MSSNQNLQLHVSLDIRARLIEKMNGYEGQALDKARAAVADGTYEEVRSEFDANYALTRSSLYGSEKEKIFAGYIDVYNRILDLAFSEHGKEIPFHVCDLTRSFMHSTLVTDVKNETLFKLPQKLVIEASYGLVYRYIVNVLQYIAGKNTLSRDEIFVDMLLDDYIYVIKRLQMSIAIHMNGEKMPLEVA